MAASTKLRLLADENDLQAVRTDPSGFLYAVLQVLRDPDQFGEADFAALIERGAQFARDQGGMLRHAQDTRGYSTVRDQHQPAAPLEPVAIRHGQRRRPKAKARTSPAGEVTYAGTEEEDERVAEAQRLRDAGVGPVEIELEQVGQAEEEGDRITLTNAQLQALMRNVALKALASATTPQPQAQPQEDDEEEDEATDIEIEDEADAEAMPPTPGEPQPQEAPEERGRDDSGRFVTSRKG